MNIVKVAALASLMLTVVSACSSTSQQMDDAWEGFSAEERANACAVFESQGAGAYVDAALRGNSDLSTSDAREWVEENLPTLCA